MSSALLGLASAQEVKFCMQRSVTAEEREILLQELVFADDAVAMLDQIDEDVEHLRLELDELAGIAQLIALQVEFVIISEDVRCRSSPPPSTRSCRDSPGRLLPEHLYVPSVLKSEPILAYLRKWCPAKGRQPLRESPQNLQEIFRRSPRVPPWHGLY
jgi:hypothetical protein